MLKEKLLNKKLILASGSPRRAAFFKELGLDFEVRIPRADEQSYPSGLDGEGLARFLAEVKIDALGDLAEGEIAVSADTVVWLDGCSLAKPSDRAESRAMLEKISGRRHSVVTGVCIASSEKRRIFSSTTFVTFRPLSSQEIDYYIDHFHPFDKAGSYGIQEWIGVVGVEKIEGSYTNVVGLPVAELYRELSEFV